MSGGDGNDTLVSASNFAGGLWSGDDGDDIFQLRESVSASIDGGLGFDTLELTSVDLRSATIANVEATKLMDVGTHYVDAADIASIGPISLSGAAVGQTVVLEISQIEGLSIILEADLQDGEVLRVTTPSGEADSNFTVAFSCSTFAGTSSIDFFGGNANETVTGGTGEDDLRGAAGNDNLQGGDGADTLLGGLGNDTLKGGLGEDELNGGEGMDTAVYSVASTAISISKI